MLKSNANSDRNRQSEQSSSDVFSFSGAVRVMRTAAFSKGYDGPVDVQRAVDEPSLHLLSLLFLLAYCGQSQCIMVRHGHAVKIKLIHLNGHPAQTHRSTQRSSEVLVKSTAKNTFVFMEDDKLKNKLFKHQSNLVCIHNVQKLTAKIHHHKRLVRNCTQKNAKDMCELT